MFISNDIDVMSSISKEKRAKSWKVYDSVTLSMSKPLM